MAVITQVLAGRDKMDWPGIHYNRPEKLTGYRCPPATHSPTEEILNMRHDNGATQVGRRGFLRASGAHAAAMALAGMGRPVSSAGKPAVPRSSGSPTGHPTPRSSA